MAAGDNKKLLLRIGLGLVVFALGGSMLLYLVPQGPNTDVNATDAVARVGDQKVTLQEVQQRLADIERQNSVPKQLETLYAQQILKSLVFQRELEYEAKRLGIRVTNEEVADRIKQFLPAAFNGDSPIGMDQYTQLVQRQFQMTVPAFEEAVRQSILQEKFQKLVTDGISVSPAEIQEQFLYQNEKVKLDYVEINPQDLQAKITPTEEQIKVEYEKNKSKYQVPEKRIAQYGLIDINKLRANVQIPDDQLKAEYQKNISQYEVPDRAHVEHILLMTVGKTDAEVAEMQKKAEDILQQLKKGAKFEDLAKKYSEDPGTKDKGGDLGWIVRGQTVPEFEKAAFSLPVGQLSGLIKTQYGFHIIKVLARETAHTKPFDEVKDSIKAPMVLAKADKEANDEADLLAAAIRQSSRTSIDSLAKQFDLTVGETRPISVTDPLLELGNSPEVKDAIFRLSQGNTSLPIQTDRGYVVVSVKSILPAHQGTLEEVRDRVISDLKQQLSTQEAQSKAEALAKRAKAGENFASAAKALGLDGKTSDLFSRAGSISGVASGKQLAAAFHMKQGDVAPPLNLGANWLVYRVDDKVEPNPDDFERQKANLMDQTLQEKRSLAFQAFQTSLENRLKQEGKLQLMPDKLKGFGDLS
ncbi:MAG TPA: peptidyl-prolyl cis-trans isomerase [Candidatus Acidoferrum sp.]|nr:peptidyl-prolyl cis-trans isomerase [Candidatus Acidoferrum sp.]